MRFKRLLKVMLLQSAPDPREVSFFLDCPAGKNNKKIPRVGGEYVEKRLDVAALNVLEVEVVLHLINK